MFKQPILRSCCGVARQVALFVAFAASQNSVAEQASATGDWLVNLARDFGVERREQPTEGDLLHVETLLLAALRVDANNPEAREILYEIAAFRGDIPGQLRQLEAILKQDPRQQAAFARWLSLSLASFNTIEEEDRWLRALLDANRPVEQRALVEIALAQTAREALDLNAAAEHTRAAAQLDPNAPGLAALEWELLADSASDIDRIQAALQLLAQNPVNPVWLVNVAVALDDAGCPDEAGAFFEQALRMFRLFTPERPPPGDFLLSLSRNRWLRGESTLALEAARDAAVADPAYGAEAGMLVLWMYSELGRTAEAIAVLKQLSERFNQIREPSEWPVQEIAYAAWFSMTFDPTPNPQRALSLAQAAAARAPGDQFVTRVLGIAQAVNGEDRAAQETLLPIAGRDPYAACEMAKILVAKKDYAAARATLEKFSTTRLADPVTAEIRKVWRSIIEPAGDSQPTTDAAGASLAASQPIAPCPAAIKAAVSNIDRSGWEFVNDPGKFLEVGVRLEDASVPPGVPWQAVFTLTNKSAAPITLGPQALVNPIVLISMTMEGDRKREFPNLFSINFDRALLLAPGASMTVRRTLDIGGPRRASRQTPQQLQRVVINGILDPERNADGNWEPAPTGQRLRPAYLNRMPANVSQESLRALFAGLIGGSDADRFVAIETIAELLGEHQRAGLINLNYRPEQVPADRLQQALLAMLRSATPEVRARTLDSLQQVGLDRTLLNAAEAGLADPDWLVRLMAVRLLARQGATFIDKARTIAGSDADELVRKLAGAYVRQWESAAASQPKSAK